MPRPANTVEYFKNRTINDMKTLGIYKIEFNEIINIYSGLLAQYKKLNKKFVSEGMEYEVMTMQGGLKKAPIVATLETLRKDILNYAAQLGLTVKGLDSVEVEKPKKKNRLESILQDLGK